LPSALDVGAWLGSEVARGALAQRGDLGYERFDAVLADLAAHRAPDETARHGSVHRSLLESIATWLRPSAADVADPPPSNAEARRRLRTALSAWTLLRHAALPFAHDVPRAPPRLSDPRARPGGPGGVLPSSERVFIEPHPEAIANLYGALEQLHRGLRQLGVVPDDSPGAAVLSEAESLLALAVEAAVRGANGDPSLAALEAELADIPARIAALEAAMEPAALPVVVDVHVDLATGRVLEEGTAPIEELFVLVRDPLTHRTALCVGASIPHVEVVESGTRLDDASWRARAAAGRMPDPDVLYEPVLVASERP
jgi:hypothetical protein